LFGFLGLGLFFLDTGLDLLPFGLQVFGHGGWRELLFLHVGVHQAQTVLAGELPARAAAAMGRLVRPREIAGTAIGLFATPQALAKQDRLILGDMEGGELVLENEAATVLDRLGVRSRRIHGPSSMAIIVALRGYLQKPDYNARRSVAIKPGT